MFNLSRKVNKPKTTMLYGSMEISPLQRSIGYYDKRSFRGNGIAELLDNMVRVASDLAEDARNAVTANEAEYLDKEIYLSVEYYHQPYGEEPQETGSGGTTTINNLVSTVAHYRVIGLQHMFVWADSRRTSAGKKNLRPEWRTEDAVSTRALMLASEHELVHDARFSAVNYLANWLPVYDAA